MSLSVLLDYRTDDNKESTFEVSLFAELFNEMLMRDSGFKLYRVIFDAPEKAKDTKESKDAKESRDKKDESKEEASEETPGAAAEEAAKKKLVSVKKDLLLACSYFDLGQSGYIESRDLEDILLSLDLSLSRAHVKKIVAKVVGQKDQVNYRAFTDKPVDEVDDKDADEQDSAGLETLGRGMRAFLPKEDTDAEAKAQDGICVYRGNVLWSI
jgi:hypothetical protein